MSEPSYFERRRIQMEYVVPLINDLQKVLGKSVVLDALEELGGAEFGHLLVCNADFVSAKQLGMQLSRTQTCMQGAKFCDFRYRPD